MKDSELKKIENDILNSMSSELKEEQQIIEKAKEAAEDLLSKKKAVIELLGERYNLRYNMANKKIIIIASNAIKEELVQKKYVPHIIRADIQNDLSTFENLSAVIEAFARHKTGMFKPEELE